MLIHKLIREEMTALLRQNINIQGEFISGRPTFIDLDSDPTTIAVFIDEANREDLTACDEEWRATLNVVIYHKSMTGEGELDDIAEQIIECVNDWEFEHFETATLMQFLYDQDTQQRTWFIANLQYEITYQR